ncbi:MAG: hypothetical protein UR20_C0054G0011 [Candidatus Woesebacteria bacterium GW2011_GWE2_31_6]|nr:MAG: hypothetical protein UR20_C0054G0011 [Candidatus Woesebacteria bacterium GW2011_GWE2_31_6]
MITKCKDCGDKLVVFDSKDLDYLFSRINWGASFIDADAARIMNGERCVCAKSGE